MTDLAALEHDLARIKAGDDPDQWALAAYRLAVAKSETARRPDDLDGALQLLERASRILTAHRAPLEHSRILTAAASCHRAAGRPEQALDLFEQAAELAAPRAAPVERAAALLNVGLIHAETGVPERAVTFLDAAVEALDPPTGEQGSRLLGAALVNRAQAHQAKGDTDSVAAAISDYERAVAVLPPDSPQAGMAAHGLGTALLERNAAAPLAAPLDAAMASFERALTVFGPTAYPFQHAITKHSLAIAYERRGRPGDLARALASVEASLGFFDPRLHPHQWQTAIEALGRLEQTLEATGEPGPRMGHIVGLMATTSADERTGLLRERLLRVASQPLARVDAELDGLTTAMLGLPLDAYDRVLRSLITVLMELPDGMLEAAAAAVCRAHQASDDTESRDRALDTVIHDTLFGPQRVRVRDLLEERGWIRP